MSDIKILVVTDKANELTIIRYSVKESGYSLVEAGSPSQALELARSHKPYLMLLDADYSALAPKEFLQIVEYAKEHKLCLILIISESLTENLQKHLNRPSIDYIKRPLDRLGVLFRIKSVMRYKDVQNALDVLRDKLKENIERFRQTVVLDEESGIYNYNHLLYLLKREFARAVRYNLSLTFISVNIPALGEIEEKYGARQKGRLLGELAGSIKKSLRISDILARCRNDRLGILLVQTDNKNAQSVGKKIYRQLKTYRISLPKLADSDISEEDLAIGANISLGFSSFPSNEINSFEELITAAEAQFSS